MKTAIIQQYVAEQKPNAIIGINTKDPHCKQCPAKTTCKGQIHGTKGSRHELGYILSSIYQQFANKAGDIAATLIPKPFPPFSPDWYLSPLRDANLINQLAASPSTKVLVLWVTNIISNLLSTRNKHTRALRLIFEEHLPYRGEATWQASRRESNALYYILEFNEEVAGSVWDIISDMSQTLDFSDAAETDISARFHQGEAITALLREFSQYKTDRFIQGEYAAIMGILGISAIEDIPGFSFQGFRSNAIQRSQPNLLT